MVYEGRKVYGPYTRKDGRQVVILKTPGSKCDHLTVSYPKYLVEKYLDRYLDDNETVDHIDQDFTNNDLSNLRIVDRAEHCRSHVSKKQLNTFTCQVCGKVFTTKRNFAKTCGSKSCNGKCAHLNGYNKGNSIQFETSVPVYNELRDTISSIQSVV